MLTLATRKKRATTPAKIGILENDLNWSQQVVDYLGKEFDVNFLNFNDIFLNQIDISEYSSILVYYAIKYPSIDISGTLDLITIIKNFSKNPPAVILTTDFADGQILAEAHTYLAQIDSVFAKDQDLALLLKMIKILLK
ncbi:MAG: hypothetical protein VKJ02_02065 [Snowella sp.]|nr:hypothetical protein [Snowella sp.]